MTIYLTGIFSSDRMMTMQTHDENHVYELCKQSADEGAASKLRWLRGGGGLAGAGGGGRDLL